MVFSIVYTVLYSRVNNLGRVGQGRIKASRGPGAVPKCGPLPDGHTFLLLPRLLCLYQESTVADYCTISVAALHVNFTNCTLKFTFPKTAGP